MSVVRRAGPSAFWPNHLKMYKDCPQRYYLQFVRKRVGRMVDTSAMTRGRVTHSVLAVAFNHLRARHSFRMASTSGSLSGCQSMTTLATITGNTMCG
ncbi:MAG: PD-(D/E)XK nuclease family protein [Chloroflexota bacterium]|nr:PD-(D/E)XK nuclease family protein [Chloroflexota bacterium]